MKYTKDTIIFDLDGTLLNSAKGVKNSFMHAFKKFGIKENKKNLDKFIGPPLSYSFGQYLKGEDIDKAVSVFSEFYVSKGYKQSRLYKGTLKMLKVLKKNGFKLYVATSKQEFIAKQILHDLKADIFFDGIYGADLKSQRLSKEAVLTYAILKTDMKINNAILIGDTLYDKEGADALGMDCAFVLYGYGKKEDLAKLNGLFYASKPSQIPLFFK